MLTRAIDMRPPRGRVIVAFGRSSGQSARAGPTVAKPQPRGGTIPTIVPARRIWSAKNASRSVGSSSTTFWV